MYTPYVERVHNRIYNLIVESGMTQTEVARQIGCTKNLVNGWFNGYHLPSAEYIAPLCKVLGVSADWLLEVDK